MYFRCEWCGFETFDGASPNALHSIAISRCRKASLQTFKMWHFLPLCWSRFLQNDFQCKLKEWEENKDLFSWSASRAPSSSSTTWLASTPNGHQCRWKRLVCNKTKNTTQMKLNNKNLDTVPQALSQNSRWVAQIDQKFIHRQSDYEYQNYSWKGEQ